MNKAIEILEGELQDLILKHSKSLEFVRKAAVLDLSRPTIDAGSWCAISEMLLQQAEEINERFGDFLQTMEDTDS